MLKPAQTVQVLQRHSEPSTFAAGDAIFREGETGDLMFGIIEGEVEMQINGKTIEILEVGDVFGVGALVHEDQLRTSTAIAKTDCKIAALDQQHFMFAVQSSPIFALEVIRSYSDRFRKAKEAIS
ncbi:MAG: cyclic nucleotide-binding domain-containing protein [Synechococcales cyanobacterium T60_A2020_003]|nr:cyclic nucleotide-binding domain-containing protein [Synechococcales cyanobacterium T60_A2020_003]